VEYLVALQKEFDKHGDQIQIVAGGGALPPDLDREGVIINISPLDEKDCANLIRASDACLLPVKKVRVSPGSPLKLYDYILNGRFVFSQAGTPGYSDEVEKYGIGIPVDFTCASSARARINKELSSVKLSAWECPEDVLHQISWSSRMKEWLRAIERLL
jgi:hypothetical protein